MKNFWKELKRPIMVLAPMADVTDCVFRKIIAKYGKPDVFWTEFVSADGLAHPKAREKLLIDLRYSVDEHPIVAQIFGGKPENIKEAARLCAELGFDGVDINMGCPDRSIEKQCAGAGMIKDPELAIKIINSAREGAGDIPVSVKTRIGYNKNEINTWIRTLLEQKLPLLTVHLRTRKEMSLVPAHWDLMKDIVALRDEISPETLIFGNGDAVYLEDARKKCAETGCDGVMLGRAIFGNPWLFANLARENRECQIEHPALFLPKHTTFESNNLLEKNTLSAQSRNRPSNSECADIDISRKNEAGAVTIQEKLEIMIEHTKLYEQELGAYKNFAIMKKHYKAYVNGFDGAKELRMKLMDAENATEVEQITRDFLSKLG